MSAIPFFLVNKERRKILFRAILIGLPILFLVGFGINYYEDSRAENGIPNDKGGQNFIKESSSGKDELPAVASKIITLYPGSKVVYYNLSTDKDNFLEGSVKAFTKRSAFQCI